MQTAQNVTIELDGKPMTLKPAGRAKATGNIKMRGSTMRKYGEGKVKEGWTFYITAVQHKSGEVAEASNPDSENIPTGEELEALEAKMNS